MWNFKLFINLSLLLLLSVTSCNRVEEDKEMLIDEQKEEIEVYHDNEIIGIVLDENGKALERVELVINEKKHFSNYEGVFIDYNLKLNDKGNLFTLRKDNYFTNYSYCPSESNGVVNFNTKMTPLSSPIILNSSEDVELKLSNNVFKIERNTFKQANGQPYNGKILLYKKEVPQLLLAPIKGINGQSKIFFEGEYYQLEAYDESGIALSMGEINVKAIKENNNLVIFDPKLNKLSELDPKVESIESAAIIGFGNLVPATKVEGFMGSSSFLLLDRFALALPNSNVPLNINQSGYFSFYMPQNSKANIIQSFDCTNSIYTYSFPTSQNSKTSLGRINSLNNEYKNINSNLKSCGEGIAKEDLLYFILAKGKNKQVFYQRKMTEKLEIPTCSSFDEVKYYSSSSRLISYKNPISTGTDFTFDQDFFCVPKYVGYLKINDKTNYFSDKQVYITREGSQTLLSVTDYKDLLISSNSVEKEGHYIPNVLLLNHPELIDCIDNCSNLKMNVEKIGSIGEKVVIRITGMISDKKIEAYFEQILTK